MIKFIKYNFNNDNLRKLHKKLVNEDINLLKDVEIYILYDNELALRYAIDKSHYDIIEYLLNLINKPINIDEKFKSVCDKNDIRLAKLLINNNYYIDIKNDKIVKYTIL